MDYDFSKIYALAVEDDISGGAMIGLMMRRIGVQAQVASSGEQGLDIAEQMDPPPDIIFLDLNLPHQNGFEVLKQIRALEHLKHTRVIAVTAMDALTGMAKCREAGFDGYIAKPLRIARFGTQISSIVEGIPIWDDGSRQEIHS